MAGVGTGCPVMHCVVVEEVRSQLVTGTVRESAQLQEEVVDVI